MSVAVESKLYVAVRRGRPWYHRDPQIPNSLPIDTTHKWRVCFIDDDGIEAITAIGFLRKQDAERAKCALEKLGCVDAESIHMVSFEDRTKAMIEALAW